MKQFLFLLFSALTFSLAVMAQEDSTRITEWVDTVDSTTVAPADNHSVSEDIFPFSINSLSDDFWMYTIATTGIVFALPVLIVFIAFFFQYKNRKARYKLAEQALAAGQPIPEEFMKIQRKENNLLSKGIMNIFVGIGLFIFLWAFLHSFAIGTIGLLVMFTGFAEVIIYYANNGKKDK